MGLLFLARPNGWRLSCGRPVLHQVSTGGRPRVKHRAKRTPAVEFRAAPQLGSRQLQPLVRRRVLRRRRRRKDAELTQRREIVGKATLPNHLSVAQLEDHDLVEFHPFAGRM